MSQKNTPEIRMVPVGQLTEHPLLERLPHIPEGNEHEHNPKDPTKGMCGSNWEAFEASVRENGVQDPLLITAKGQVLDGRRRLKAAKITHGEIDLPCMVISDDEAHEAMFRSVCHRRHLTKSAIAYVIYPLLEPIIAESRERRIANIKNVNSPNVSSGDDREPETVERLSRRYGIGRNLLFHAQKLHTAWAEGRIAIKKNKDSDPGYYRFDPERVRPAVEDAIFVDGVGLGGAIAGIPGRGILTGGPQTDITRQLDLFKGVFTAAKTRWHYWGNFDENQKREALQAAEDMIDAMPEDLRAELAKKLTALPKGDWS